MNMSRMLLTRFTQSRNKGLSKKNGIKRSRSKMKSSKPNKSVGMQKFRPTKCVIPKPVSYAA
jgi:hypothetical protein